MTYFEIAEEFRGKILKDYGPSCADFFLTCPVCQAWLAYKILLETAGSENAPTIPDAGHKEFRNKPQHWGYSFYATKNLNG